MYGAADPLCHACFLSKHKGVTSSLLNSLISNSGFYFYSVPLSSNEEKITDTVI